MPETQTAPTSKARTWLLLGLFMAAIGGCFVALFREQALGGGKLVHYGLRVVTVVPAQTVGLPRAVKKPMEARAASNACALPRATCRS